MTLTDPIADMLTVIRNGVSAAHPHVIVRHSKMKEGILQVLKDEGYISRFEVLDTLPGKTIKVGLKYGPAGERVINTIKRISSPGCRVYAAAGDLKKVIGGFGIRILSTNSGILSDRTCRAQKIGGEVLCLIK